MTKEFEAILEIMFLVFLEKIQLDPKWQMTMINICMNTEYWH